MRKGSAAVLATVGEAVILWGFWKFGVLFPFAHPDTPMLSLEAAIGRVAIIGTFVAAMLSGYGAIQRPYDMWLYWRTPRVSHDDVALLRAQEERWEQVICTEQAYHAQLGRVIERLQRDAAAAAVAAATEGDELAVKGGIPADAAGAGAMPEPSPRLRHRPTLMLADGGGGLPAASSASGSGLRLRSSRRLMTPVNEEAAAAPELLPTSAAAKEGGARPFVPSLPLPRAPSPVQVLRRASARRKCSCGWRTLCSWMRRLWRAGTALTPAQALVAETINHYEAEMLACEENVLEAQACLVLINGNKALIAEAEVRTLLLRSCDVGRSCYLL